MNTTSTIIPLKTKLADKCSIPTTSLRKAILKQIKEPYLENKKAIEHTESNPAIIRCDWQPLCYTAYIAFAEHLNYCLTPDTIWFTIMQGFATHISENPEKYKSKFVNHQGKDTIKIHRDEFILGEKNDWNGVIEEFKTKIISKVKDENIEKLVAPYSTTTPIAQLCVDIALMDSMKQYFDYRVMTKCGIPNIIIEGTKQDWQDIIDRIELLKDYDLDKWVEAMVPVLSNVRDSIDGKSDENFWNSMFSYRGGSGGDSISGWLGVFIPYIFSYNKKLEQREEFTYCHYKTEALIYDQINFGELPTGICQTDFIWEYYGKEISMKLLGGLVGASIDNDLILKPEFGYMICHKG